MVGLAGAPNQWGFGSRLRNMAIARSTNTGSSGSWTSGRSASMNHVRSTMASRTTTYTNCFALKSRGSFILILSPECRDTPRTAAPPDHSPLSMRALIPENDQVVEAGLRSRADLHAHQLG